jgi:hypothetical protein
MGVLTPVIEVATLPVFHPGQDLALRCPVALQLIRDDRPWHVLQALEQCAKELLGGVLVAAALHQNIEDVVVLVNRAPEVMALTINRQKDLVEMPFVPGPRPSAFQPIGVILPKLATPLADRFVGHSDAALEQQLLGVTVAQGKPIVEPDTVADDFAGKAVVLIARGVGRRGHV